jgi:hypothetical protein
MAEETSNVKCEKDSGEQDDGISSVWSGVDSVVELEQEEEDDEDEDEDEEEVKE